MRFSLDTLRHRLGHVPDRIYGAFSGFLTFVRNAWNFLSPRLISTSQRTLSRFAIAAQSVAKLLAYRVDVETVFAPKQLRVTDCWVSVIIWNENNEITFLELPRVPSRVEEPIDEALARLRRLSAQTRADLPKKAVPVFCLQDVNPLIEGVRALLLPNLPTHIEGQIAALHLRRPIDFRTDVGPERTGALGKTLVDLDSDRSLVIGNARWFCRALATLSGRLDIPNTSSKAVRRIRDVLSAYNIAPVGSSLLIGAFGTVFAFEAAFLITRIQGIDTHNHAWLLIACVLTLLGTLGFLVHEGLESHIVAMSPWWTIRTNTVSWIVFLGGILVTPICFFVSIDGRLLCEIVRWAGVALFMTCSVTSLGHLYFQAGLTKRLVLVWWLFLIFLIAVLPLLDLFASR